MTYYAVRDNYLHHRGHGYAVLEVEDGEESVVEDNLPTMKAAWALHETLENQES